MAVAMAGMEVVTREAPKLEGYWVWYDGLCSEEGERSNRLCFSSFVGRRYGICLAFYSSLPT